MHEPPRREFLNAKRRRRSILYELWGFTAHHRKWWLLPILLILLALGVTLVTGGGAIAPFLYALF